MLEGYGGVNPVKTSSRLMVIFILTVVLFSFMGTGSLPAGTAINDSHEFALFTAIGPPGGIFGKDNQPLRDLSPAVPNGRI